MLILFVLVLLTHIVVCEQLEESKNSNCTECFKIISRLEQEEVVFGIHKEVIKSFLKKLVFSAFFNVCKEGTVPQLRIQ